MRPDATTSRTRCHCGCVRTMNASPICTPYRSRAARSSRASPAVFATPSTPQRTGVSSRVGCDDLLDMSGAGERECERRARAERALDREVAAHAAREVARDREPESDAFLHAREARVDLHERLEDD